MLDESENELGGGGGGGASDGSVDDVVAAVGGSLRRKRTFRGWSKGEESIWEFENRDYDVAR